MRLRSLFLGTAAAILVPALAFAQAEWEEGMARGLVTYSTQADGGRFVMVCDPDRVYNPDVSYANLVVDMPRDPSANQIVFLASTGQQAAFDVIEGTVSQQDARPGDWEALVQMIRNGGEFAVVTARDTFSLDMVPFPDFECS